MSPSAYITSRVTTKGEKRYVVRYRRGGRGFKVEHAGSFPSQREAKIRRDFVAGELAAGRDPRKALRAAATAKTRTYRDWAEAYVASRIDLADTTGSALDAHLKRLLPVFGDRDPGTITVSDCQEWLAANADLKPSSIKGYFATHRLILDFAGVEPNPARDPRVKLPKVVSEEARPPSGEHFLALLDRMAPRWRLPLIVLEQTAMRVGELSSLTWGDVDESGNRFRLRARETKASRARWAQLPEWLMALVSATCPTEDRTAERRVFAGLNPNVAHKAMARACVAARIPHYHPHDLRHRRASLWHGQGVPARELQERGGWSSATLPLDTYSHVMPLDEVPQESFEAVLVRSR